jgi:hypothetical protein
VFFLKYTPVIPNFGQFENDFDILEKFIEANQTDKGIRTNLKRLMIVAEKEKKNYSTILQSRRQGKCKN